MNGEGQWDKGMPGLLLDNVAWRQRLLSAASPTEHLFQSRSISRRCLNSMPL